MKTLRLILGDQLSRSISSLDHIDQDADVILMCEVMDEATYVHHHKKKIVFLFSAMRHFAQDLKSEGLTVDYVCLEDSENSGSFFSEVRRAVHKHKVQRVVVTFPGEYRVYEDMLSWSSRLGLDVEIKKDNRFLSDLDEFKQWASDRKNLRMEFFYRDMRRKYSILMDGDQPVGGTWNYDSENRKTPPGNDLFIPRPYLSQPDDTTKQVMLLVSERFSDHFGDLEPFYFAVTRAQALEILEQFFEERLSLFGDYQDAMLEGQPWMYHSHISFYLNCGLLNPLEVVQRAEDVYRAGKAPLNAVEGFIRQIMGWREYVRGIYWMKMPGYENENFLDAKRSLPWFFWSGETDMNCLRQCIDETKRHAYAHHIQRLMVLGNFALLCGVHPRFVNAWYLIVYADAYEWVEMPNVSGMILFADGGYLASKPYAASGAYINKMSNYCKNCQYDVQEKTGPKACPFNYLYWNFMIENAKKLRGNPRLSYSYNTLDKMTKAKKEAITSSSSSFFKKIAIEAE
jgi:deoxyribodipyrimidine photolyase-related protein